MNESLTFFDTWAESYDQDVFGTNSFPFIEFEKLLTSIANHINSGSILDLGCGTCELYRILSKKEDIDYLGLDFSPKMLEFSKLKFPKVNTILTEFDFFLTSENLQNRYDFIVSNYFFHHFTDFKKIDYISNLLPLLKAEGKIIIGDISFKDLKSYNKAYAKYANMWDVNEYYIINEQFKLLLPPNVSVEFIENSEVNGILLIKE